MGVPTVFYKDGNPVFHQTDSCVQLTKKPARGEPHPVLSTDLKDLLGVRPCQACYPDAPRPRVVRRHCPVCNKSKITACPHNGGVPVKISYSTNYVGLLRDPGDLMEKTIYVWPDNVYRYTHLMVS